MIVLLLAELLATYHSQPARPEIFAGAPDRVHAGEVASHALYVQLQNRNKWYRRAGVVWTRKAGQGVDLVRDEVNLLGIAELDHVLDNIAGIALPERILGVCEQKSLDRAR